MSLCAFRFHSFYPPTIVLPVTFLNQNTYLGFDLRQLSWINTRENVFSLNRQNGEVNKQTNRRLHCIGRTISIARRQLEKTYVYYTILYYTILYYTILYYTILYYTILYYTILYYTILYYTLHCTALHCTALHCTALHCTALHCTALHCTALHCTALYYTILYYTIYYTNALVPINK